MSIAIFYHESKYLNDQLTILYFAALYCQMMSQKHLNWVYFSNTSCAISKLNFLIINHLV